MVAQVKAPLSADGNWTVGKKSGSADVQCVPGLYAWGDCSIAAAAADGELKKLYYADYEQISFLGFVTVFNLTAYGE